MSSKASKRSARRKAAQTPVGKLKVQLKAAQQQAGEARMAVMNMRQMYRQAEQEILMLRDQSSKVETLAAAVMYATETYSVVVTSEDMEGLAEEFSSINTQQTPEGTLVSLVPLEDVEYEDEEVEDEDMSEVPADE